MKTGKGKSVPAVKLKIFGLADNLGHRLAESWPKFDNLIINKKESKINHIVAGVKLSLAVIFQQNFIGRQ